MKTLIKSMLFFIFLSNVSNAQLSKGVTKIDFIGSARGLGIVDTIKAGDTVKTFNIKGVTTDNYLNIYNQGASIDTFIVRNKSYNSSSVLLGTTQMTVTSVYDNTVYSLLIVPNATQRRYLLNDKLISVLEIIRISGAGAAYSGSNTDLYFIVSGDVNK